MSQMYVYQVLESKMVAYPDAAALCSPNLFFYISLTRKRFHTAPIIWSKWSIQHHYFVKPFVEGVSLLHKVEPIQKTKTLLYIIYTLSQKKFPSLRIFWLVPLGKALKVLSRTLPLKSKPNQEATLQKKFKVSPGCYSNPVSFLINTHVSITRRTSRQTFQRTPDVSSRSHLFSICRIQHYIKNP